MNYVLNVLVTTLANSSTLFAAVGGYGRVFAHLPADMPQLADDGPAFVAVTPSEGAPSEMIGGNDDEAYVVHVFGFDGQDVERAAEAIDALLDTPPHERRGDGQHSAVFTAASSWATDYTDMEDRWLIHATKTFRAVGVTNGA